MNGENGRNVEKRRCKCLLLGIIFYLYASVAAVAIVLNGVDAADAMAAEPNQQQKHQHTEQRESRSQSGAGSGGGGGGGEIPLVRLPSNTLLKYTAYKDVSILHFHIPADTRTANFNFKAYEETKSAFRKYPLHTHHQHLAHISFGISRDNFIFYSFFVILFTVRSSILF